MGRTTEWGCGLSASWASSGSGEDLGAVGQLEPLHVIRVQSDDRVVIIDGFFLSRIAVESPFFPSDRRKIIGFGSV